MAEELNTTAVDQHHVLVTGGAGYIGCVLVEMLLQRGFRVTVLDRFFFGPTLRPLESNPKLHLVKGDTRTFEASLLDGIDSVCDLAALSNDPAGELNPEKTKDINFRGRARVASLAKERGVLRYVLASSCSIYGFQEGVLDEDSEPNPLTVYASANLDAEHANLPLSSAEFSVTVLRQATVYGLSPRMRFDVAVNGMALGAWKDGVIPVLRDGTQWRPMVHVRDTCNAFITTLTSEPSAVNGQIFNVGSDEQNFQISELAQRVGAATGREFRCEWYGAPDHRSYRVSFSKIREVLGYEARLTPEEATREICSALNDGRTEPSLQTRTVDWYKHLLEAQRLVEDVALDGVIL